MGQLQADIEAVTRAVGRNDRLRDAAPEMFELLKAIRKKPCMSTVDDHLIDDIIAKVEGRSEESENGTE